MKQIPKQSSDKKKQEQILKQKESVMLIRSNESIYLEQKQKNIIFTKLPARLVNIILEMIAPNEIYVLRSVCRWFKDYIDSNDNLIAIQVFSLFFPKQVDFFCDYGENDIFLQERSKKNYLMSHNTRSQSKWKQFLKLYEDVRENFLSSNYKIFLFAEEQLKKNQNNDELGQLSLKGLEGVAQNRNEGETKAKGLQPLGQLDMQIDEPNSSIDLFGFGVNSAQNAQQQQQDKENKFKFALQGVEDEDQQQMEQIDNNKGIFFQFNKNQTNDSQDSENIDHSSLNIEIQDVCNINPSQSKLKAQRMSQVSSKYIWGVLKDPPLPILKLRRENIGNYCNTWFQNKLAEVLWEGSRQIGLGLHQYSEEEQPLVCINNIIRDNKAYFIDEIKQTCDKWPFQKKDILNMRYYYYKNQPTLSALSKQAKKPISQNLNNIKAGSPKTFFSLKQRGMSIIEENSNVMSNNKCLFSTNTSTAIGCSMQPQNPVVFNFFDEQNKDQTDQINLQNTSHQNPQSSQQKGIFDDIFQFAHKSPNQDQDLFEDIELDNQNENQNGFQVDEMIVLKQKPLLLHFIESLIDLFIFKCQLIYEYLKEHMNGLNESSSGAKKNGFDLLSEYNIKWNSYIAFLTEIEEQLKDVFEIFNEAFDQIFEDYPQHPRLSIWRLMVKIWIQEIYSKDDLKENLFGCFLKVLSIRRHENFQFQMRQIELDSKVQQQYYMPDQLEYISLTLLNNLTKNKNFSLLNYGEGYDYFHSFFSKNQYHVDSLLSSFVESTIDLSLNEISVHYLGHSLVQMDSPYLELEKQLLDSSQTYYRHQQSMFLQNPSNYLLFLKGDLKYVSKIFKERSQVLLRKKMLEHWKEMFKDIISQKIPKQLDLFEEKDEKTKNLIQQHVKQLIQNQKLLQANQLQADNNMTQSLNFTQQNTIQQDGEEASQQQQQQQQQQHPQLQQSNGNENLDQSPAKQFIQTNDTLPSLIYQILEEQEIKQKQQEFLQIELNSKSPSLETHNLLFQKSSNNDNTVFSEQNNAFFQENKDIFKNILSSNQKLFNSAETEVEDELPIIPGFSTQIVEEKKEISKRSNTTNQNQQQQATLKIEDIEKIHEKAHIISQMFRMSDDQMKIDIQNYIETCKLLQEISSTKSDQDLEIEELNNMRRLPILLNGEEQIFFFLTKQLTEEILNETIQKQKQFMRQQRESNADADADSDEEEEEENEDDGEEEEDDDDNDNDDQSNQNQSQYPNQGNNQNQRNIIRFDDNSSESSEEIQALNLQNNKQNQQKRKKQNKAKIQQEQDIPVYNSGDESDSFHDDVNENKNFFNIKKQESNASNFSLGLDKEQSRISNHILFADNVPDTFIAPMNNSNENKIEFQFNFGEQQEEEQPAFDLFKMEKQNSGIPNTQINMFSFKLQSNDTVNIQYQNKQQQTVQEKSYFANYTPQISQNHLCVNNINNQQNLQQIDFFSAISSENKEQTSSNSSNQPTTTSSNMFLNLLNNIKNEDQQHEEGDIEPSLKISKSTQ